jgi:hypothetical protein
VFVVAVYLLMLGLVSGDIGNFRSDIASQRTNYISYVWNCCQIVLSCRQLLSVKFGAVVLFIGIMESSSWGVAIVWVDDNPFAVFFVLRGSFDNFFLSGKFSWLGKDNFETSVFLVVFGFELDHVSSCLLISARARGEFAFVKFTN